MKPIERGEILGLAEYEQVRERVRGRIIEEKKRRRVQLGPKASAVFENRDTVLLQIQEMLRTERITRADAVQHEIDTYNELVPGASELSCTLMIEIPDREERERFLVDAGGFEKHVWLVSGDVRVPARSAERPGADERTTAVHYMKFALPAALAQGLASDAKTPLALVVDHPAYRAEAPLSAQALDEIRQDLRA